MDSKWQRCALSFDCILMGQECETCKLFMDWNFRIKDYIAKQNKRTWTNA